MRKNKTKQSTQLYKSVFDFKKAFLLERTRDVFIQEVLCTEGKRIKTFYFFPFKSIFLLVC